MEKITFTIDGVAIAAEKGTSILKAALQNNIYIPHLCCCPALEPRGACRLCMVEVDNKQLVTSCRMLAESGMTVKTKSPIVDKAVRPVVELLIANHHVICRDCPGSGRCELQKIMAHLHVDRGRVRRLRSPREELPNESWNLFLDHNPNKCVLCGICVQTCEATQGVSLLYYMGRGYSSRIAFFGDKTKCELCQQCVARCPVGALIPKGKV
jgi:bidirectional [NiFe] hydrogenase diaphorase subunit